MNYMQEYRLAYSEMMKTAGEMGITINEDDDVMMSVIRIVTNLMKHAA
mgnify:FL=1